MTPVLLTFDCGTRGCLVSPEPALSAASQWPPRGDTNGLKLAVLARASQRRGTSIGRDGRENDPSRHCEAPFRFAAAEATSRASGDDFVVASRRPACSDGNGLKSDVTALVSWQRQRPSYLRRGKMVCFSPLERSFGSDLSAAGTTRATETFQSPLERGFGSDSRLPAPYSESAPDTGGLAKLSSGNVTAIVHELALDTPRTDRSRLRKRLRLDGHPHRLKAPLDIVALNRSNLHRED